MPFTGVSVIWFTLPVPCSVLSRSPQESPRHTSSVFFFTVPFRSASQSLLGRHSEPSNTGILSVSLEPRILKRFQLSRPQRRLISRVKVLFGSELLLEILTQPSLEMFENTGEVNSPLPFPFLGF